MAESKLSWKEQQRLIKPHSSPMTGMSQSIGHKAIWIGDMKPVINKPYKSKSGVVYVFQANGALRRI